MNPEHLKILNQGVKQWNEWRFQKRRRVIPNLRNAKLSSANLMGVIFVGVALSNAKLSNADLSNADLSYADLSYADLSAANLSGANLSGANLSGSYLDGTDLMNSLLSETIFGDTDLKTVRNLDSCRHQGPSIIDQRTLVKSGNLPEVFLKGCGLSDEFIQQIPFLFWDKAAFEFYSCFISYNNQDEDFARRLHADLQSEGVRCWFAPEDIKIGDKFRQRIDETIRLYDKLLLILSENSINSTWVEKEVETAFEKEIRLKKEGQDKHTVLFPVRLDDGVMGTGTAWAADIRRTRHIGDFSRWKDHDDYQKALERLLRDLRAS